VPHLDEFDFAFASLERAEDPVYAVSREAVDPTDPPLVQTFNNEIADGFHHGDCPCEGDRPGGRRMRRSEAH
jgi:hypothetical protein